jgi:hypothetical protein
LAEEIAMTRVDLETVKARRHSGARGTDPAIGQIIFISGRQRPGPREGGRVEEALGGELLVRLTGEGQVALSEITGVTELNASEGSSAMDGVGELP